MRRLLVLGFLLSGCLGRKNAEANNLEGYYTVGRLSNGWTRVSPGGADKAWFNEEIMAMIYTDSNCGSHYDDGDLDNLQRRLVSGMDALTHQSESWVDLDNRAALLKVYDGRLDGVPFRLGALALKKNNCLFEIIYLAPPSRFEDGWEDFMAVMAGFRSTSRGME